MKQQLFTAVASVLAIASITATAVAAPSSAETRKARLAQAADPEAAQPSPALPPAPAPAPAPAPTQGPAPAPAPTVTPAPPVAKGEGADAIAIETPPASSPPTPGLLVRPYFLIAGGLKYDVPKGRPEETKQNRVSTFALGRFGVKATWNDLVDAESELMASGGTSLHGASAYEGQAALQVRQQVLRLHHDAWKVEVGRLIDEASVDYFSAHVAETFLQDTATRNPLLFDGYNLGNGIRGQLELVKGLRAAITFNAGNPVATTSSLMVGGSYPPFERFYTQPQQAVGRDPNHFPDDTFHMLVLTPSLMFDTKYIDGRFAVQGFDVTTNTDKASQDDIRGYNARGTIRLKLLDGLLVPFANAAYTRNDTLVPNDLGKRSADRYQAINLGGGIDIDVARRFQCAYDCADGFGMQYQQVQYVVGEGLVTTNRYANVGATFWIVPNVSLGARFAFWNTRQEGSAATGETSGILALRFIMN